MQAARHAHSNGPRLPFSISSLSVYFCTSKASTFVRVPAAFSYQVTQRDNRRASTRDCMDELTLLKRPRDAPLHLLLVRHYIPLPIEGALGLFHFLPAAPQVSVLALLH